VVIYKPGVTVVTAHGDRLSASTCARLSSGTPRELSVPCTTGGQKPNQTEAVPGKIPLNSTGEIG